MLCIRKDLVSSDEARKFLMTSPLLNLCPAYVHRALFLATSEEASKKIGKLSKEICAREAQLRSEAIVTEEYERRILEMEALVNDAKEREEQIHAG